MPNKPNTLIYRIFGLILGLILDSYANSLTIIGNNGNGIWTGATVEFHSLVNIPLSLSMFIFGFLGITINLILIHRIDWIRITGGLIYMAIFSPLVDIFTNLNLFLGMGNLNFWFRLLLTIIGTFLIGVGVSLYQRSNSAMHPNDDNTNILRFDYCHGSANKAQFINMGTLFLIVLICSIFTKNLSVLGMGTVLGFLVLGTTIKFTDKYILPSLKHNY